MQGRLRSINDENGMELNYPQSQYISQSPKMAEVVLPPSISQDIPNSRFNQNLNAKKSKVGMEEEHRPNTTTVMFGDEYSSLLGQYERTLYLVDLDKALLSCSLSESGNSFPYHEFDYKATMPLIIKPVDQGKKHRVLRIHKALKKLARPAIFKHKKSARKCHIQREGDKVHFACKTFSRSLGY